MTTSRELHKKWMKNPKYAEEYAKLAPEYARNAGSDRGAGAGRADANKIAEARSRKELSR